MDSISLPRFVIDCLLRIALIGAVAACDPAIGSGISVAPSPVVAPATLERSVLSTTESVARRNGLTREDDIDHVESSGWLQCYHRGGLRLCAKTEGATTQLLLTEFPTFHFSRWADSVRRELLDSLRARFDSQHVRECKWNTRVNACTEPHPVQRARTGTTSFVLEGNRVYALVNFLKPDGTAHPAYVFVDMGAADMSLSAPLYDLLRVNTGAPARFNVGNYTVEEPASNIRRGGAPNVRTSGPQLEASLPASVLQHHLVILDYAHRTLTVGDPGVVSPEGTPVPFRLDTATGLITVDATIDGETYPITIDNGSAYTWVRQESANQWLRRHPNWERGVGAVGAANMMLRGEQAEREGVLIRIPEISVGSMRLTQVGALAVAGGRGADTSLALMDWYSRKNAVPVLGWLGGNIFKAFRLTIDYQKRVMYWARQTEVDTTDLHQIGLTLRTAPRAVYVAAIATKNGKPTVEGVQPGDRLISVAGHELVSGTIGQIFDSMHGAPGDARELVLERNGVRFTVTAFVTAF